MTKSPVKKKRVTKGVIPEDEKAVAPLFCSSAASSNIQNMLEQHGGRFSRNSTSVLAILGSLFPPEESSFDALEDFHDEDLLCSLSAMDKLFEPRRIEEMVCGTPSASPY